MKIIPKQAYDITRKHCLPIKEFLMKNYKENLTICSVCGSPVKDLNCSNCYNTLETSTTKEIYQNCFGASKTLRENYNKKYQDNVVGITITGNPGTRKTFLSKDLKQFLESIGFKVLHQLEPAALIIRQDDLIKHYNNKHWRD